MKWSHGLAGGCWLGLLVSMSSVEAQQNAPVDAYAAAVVRCESHDMLWTHCPMPTAQGVQLVRQLSDNDCIRGSEWGVDVTGVWVTQGCRAEFLSIPSEQPHHSVMRRLLHCESSGRVESCPVMLHGAPVRLMRQLSAMPCQRERSWGVGRNEIWVARGCRGEFEIGARDGSGFPPGARVVLCESKGHAHRRCGVSVEDSVQLLRQLSGSACVQDDSWGWDRDGIWVDKGCRAEFSVN
ncbi:DUF3011 domain-containing protein [Xanthomonas albilineans]|uniref:Hypothetical_protein n=1 Tax=Xanthomonas albilineans (strain GPE PC73 / CFBP 7063) TaxID=380358 RepID=D2UDW6_XANAP|nr:hypothetical_protein [Xanthomonas albilineans GPE PC73]